MPWKPYNLQDRASALAVSSFVVALTVSGCGGSEAATSVPPSTTTLPPVTAQVPDATTTTAVGPQALPSSGFAEPGEYYTTVFQPTVMFLIVERRILEPFQFGESAAGFHNREPYAVPPPPGVRPYRGVAVHNHWLGLSRDEVIAEIAERETVELGAASEVEVAGFPGTQIDATVTARTLLWGTPTQTVQGSFWMLEPNQVVRFIILDTPAGSLLITIGADAEEWESFVPVAEEILAGISFPDLD